MIFFFRFPFFPDPESGNPEFYVVPVNQLEKSFNLIGHMIFFRISGFSGFSGSGSGNPDLLLSRIDPGVKPDPMVPHMWLKPCWRPRFAAALALCNIDKLLKVLDLKACSK